jgi:hypothetical protein
LPPPRHGRGPYNQSGSLSGVNTGGHKNNRKRKHATEASSNAEMGENESNKKGKPS